MMQYQSIFTCKLFMRTIIDIPEEQLAPLAEICRQQHISEDEAILQALTIFLNKQAPELHAAFGIWSKRNLNGLEYQRRLRTEWPA